MTESHAEHPERILKHIRDAVWGMQTPADIKQVLVAIKNGLETLKLPFFSCSISTIEPQDPAPIIHFWATTRDGQWLKDDAPARDNHPILAFVQKKTPTYRPDLDADDPFGEKEPVQKGYKAPIRCLIDVPYQYGTLSLSSLNAHAFTAEHTAFLQALLPHFEDALHRLEDLQTLEEHIEINKDLEDFTTVASHDLKAPLRRISQLAKLLKNNHSQADAQEANAHYIDLIIGQAQTLNSLVDQLLIYAKAKNLEEPLRPVDLQTMVAKAVDHLVDIVHEKNAEVIIDALPTVQGEPLSLLQLFQNLIENGLKYQRQTRPRIEISAHPAGDQWCIAVKDNGIGIDPQSAKLIFEPFKRLYPSSEFNGSGIGLATCKRIVEYHQGKIWVRSALGQGATFFCTFNRVPQDKAQ